jgi:multiple antibiotic resistance protein
MPEHTFVFAFATLFVVIDPVGQAPIFISLTPGLRPAERRAVARRGVLVAAAVLVAFAWGGEPLLRVLGISLPAFRIAGGILLLLLAVDMLMARQTGLRATTPGEDSESAHRPDISVFPLAIPLIAGPGALTSVIMLMGRAGGNVPIEAGIVGVLLLVLALTLACLYLADLLLRLLGVIGVNVVTRISGILLAALAVQFIADGAIEIWHSAAAAAAS